MHCIKRVGLISYKIKEADVRTPPLAVNVKKMMCYESTMHVHVSLELALLAVNIACSLRMLAKTLSKRASLKMGACLSGTCRYGLQQQAAVQ